MKKILFVLGLGGISYAIYNYLNKQLDLAMDWDFKISKFMPRQIYNDRLKASFNLQILNKSNFTLTINSYDVSAFYKDKLIGTTSSETTLDVEGDSWVNMSIMVEIYFKQIISTAGSIAPIILNEKPLFFNIKGTMNVTFQGINRVLIIDKKNIEATDNLSKSLGLDKPIDKVKDWLSGLGIKI